MVKWGIVLGHIISNEEIEVNSVKVNLVTNLPHTTCVKDMCSFLDVLY